MIRKVLLLEPPYRNKYPPMGLMKLATYFRQKGDDTRFFKGDLNALAVELLFEECWENAGDPALGEYASRLRQYIKDGKRRNIENLPDGELKEKIIVARKRFRQNDFPKFNIICVTTLFTFYWKETIETIQAAKKFLAEDGKIIVGGISSTILAEEFYRETGIMPYRNERGGSLLDKAGQIDADSDVIIDELPLDYSLLEETDYNYPASDAFFAYATHGCPNHCAFCAVPRLEPLFSDFKSIKKRIEESARRFGSRKNLLLLDNNVLVSRHFDSIIDEIKELGFAKGALHHPSNEYEIAIENIRNNYNRRAYIRKIIAIYDQIAESLGAHKQGKFYIERENRFLLYGETASAEAILDFDREAAPLYEQYVYSRIRSRPGVLRSVDFNQGLDARLLDDKKIARLAEINISPLRIAFDYWGVDPQHPNAGPMRDVYGKAVELAARYGIRDLSNYLLYNTNDDTPDELYLRLALNVQLCDDLKIKIYSFPMKYHPIDDPEYYMNRNFVGRHWRRKHIRAVQAILNSTHGKIGKGKNFFEAAFGKDLNAFHEILLMPETFIIERYKYDSQAYELYLSHGGRRNPAYTAEVMERYGGMTAKWREAYAALSENRKKTLLPVIENNVFTKESAAGLDPECREVLDFYLTPRHGRQ